MPRTPSLIIHKRTWADSDEGATLKLLGNLIIISSIQAYGEAYALSDAIDFDPSVFHEMFRQSAFTTSSKDAADSTTLGTVFPAPPLFNYSNKISKGAFGLPGFSIEGGLKGDGRFCLSILRADHLQTPDSCSPWPKMPLIRSHYRRSTGPWRT